MDWWDGLAGKCALCPGLKNWVWSPGFCKVSEDNWLPWLTFQPPNVCICIHVPNNEKFSKEKLSILVEYIFKNFSYLMVVSYFMLSFQKVSLPLALSASVFYIITHDSPGMEFCVWGVRLRINLSLFMCMSDCPGMIFQSVFFIIVKCHDLCVIFCALYSGNLSTTICLH